MKASTKWELAAVVAATIMGACYQMSGRCAEQEKIQERIQAVNWERATEDKPDGA